MDDSELERKAVEELLKEANRAKIRAETMGTAGWMKCPLGSTNKRFLLNTLGSSALMPRSQGASERGGDKQGYRTCEKHRNKDCETCSRRKDNSHRFNSHSHSSKHQSSSRSGSTSRSHSPYSRKSDRTRSRSPVRDRSADVQKYTDNRKKLCDV